MTLCWSRHQYAELVWDQKVPTWLGCHQRAFRFFGAVPRRVIIDNPKCAITKASLHDPEVHRAYAELAEAYDFKIDPCPPRDPQKKGRVESGVKFIKRSFLPEREFRDLADANRQLEAWVLGEAGNRIHGTTKDRPLTRFTEVEKEELQALPEQAFEPCEWHRLQLHKDCHFRLGECFYSAPFGHIGEVLWVRATATMVQAFDGHELVASHCRKARPGEESTLEDHLTPEALAHLRQTPAWCGQQAENRRPFLPAARRASPRRSCVRASTGRAQPDSAPRELRPEPPGGWPVDVPWPSRPHSIGRSRPSSTAVSIKPRSRTRGSQRHWHTSTPAAAATAETCAVSWRTEGR